MKQSDRQDYDEKLKFYKANHSIKATWADDRLIELWEILSKIGSKNPDGANWESYYQRQSNIGIAAREVLSKIFELSDDEIKNLEIQKLREENARLKEELEQKEYEDQTERAKEFAKEYK